jgi:chromosome segregation protein
MYLKSLELTGFKSFAEARIEFPQGITAVVGPNGAGKSNVVDAVLWVLGEQSTKTLRSERMEDVIFNGTEARKPLGMAEVSLIMSGLSSQMKDGEPPLPGQLGDYAEVMITRRLYRNGDSEYLINKTLCRLKDIRSLFLDTRAGTKGHTVIEQGRIEQILNASPRDRRELIEETAGIVRYKKQKAEALRKLDSTQQNLLRVRDIVAEVQRQLNYLERQARQARSYRTLQDEAKALEIRLLAREHRALVAGQAGVESELGRLDVVEAGHMAEQARLDQELEAVRMNLTAEDQAVARIRETLARLDHQQAQAMAATEVERGRMEVQAQQRTQESQELARLKDERQRAMNAVAELRTRISQVGSENAAGAQALAAREAEAGTLTGRRAGVADEEEKARQRSWDIAVQTTADENALAGMASRMEEIGRRAERLAMEMAGAEQERAITNGRAQAARATLQEAEARLRARQDERGRRQGEVQALETQLQEADRQIARQQEELASTDARLRTLRGVLREEIGYGRGDGDESSSLRKACGGVREAVAEWLTVPSKYERAFEAALGERMRAWLVDAPTDARDGVAFLKRQGLGRGAFVPARPRGAGGAPSWWSAVSGQSGVVGRAVELVKTVKGSPEALACLLGHVVIVETLDAALALWERKLASAADGAILVTLDGDVVDAAGVVTGGSRSDAGGVLQRRRETEQLEGGLAELNRRVDDARRERERMAATLAASKAGLLELEAAIREAETQVLAFSQDEAGFRLQTADLDRRIETIRTERAASEQDRVSLEQERVAGRQRLEDLKKEKVAREAGLSALAKTLAALDEEARACQHKLMDARVAVASVRARQEHDEADLARLLKEQEERVARIAALEQHLASLAEATKQSQAERERNDALLKELALQADAVKSELVKAQDDQTRDTGRARQLEESLALARKALAASREARTGIEVRRAEIKTHLTTLEATLSGTYQLTVAQALALEPEPPEGETEGEGAADAPKGESTAELSKTESTVELRERLQKVRERLERMGAINLAAIEEHRELEERHKFMTAQEEDLSNSIKSLKEIIAKINRTTKQMFEDTFNELQQKFGEVFGRFFPGGRAELVLVEPEPGEEPEPGTAGELGVDIVAQPAGKKLKTITMLSGGEKTLTAMALIFASFLIRPTPFCILDEIDAPLDEENIGRFTTVLKELSRDAQFIVITHNKRTMGVADSLFGVTMEEPGISKLVSVHLADLQPA